MSPLPPGRRTLELALDYRCNLRCVGCHACHDTGEQMSTQGIAALLRQGRADGVETLWLGGGEPTLRDDLLRVVRAARSIGYREVIVQTNGLRLAYADYRDALLAAGVTEVRLNVKSHRADVHDRLSGRDGAHALLVDALAGLATSPVRLVADVLLTRATIVELASTVAFFADRGITSFALWLLSAADGGDDVLAEVPRIAELVPHLDEAAALCRARSLGIVSFHTPPCTLPEQLRSLFLPAAELALAVVGPDGRPFALEASSFEGGAYLPGCAGCSARARCGGPRADYLRAHGPGELVPLSD